MADTCTHFDEICKVKPKTKGCEECLKMGGNWVHLRLRLTCGHVACRDSSKNGIRDVASGLIVLTMMLTADTRSVGIALLVQAIIPLGDMSIILGSGGSKSRAFSIHGVTCAVMLVVGLLLIHAI